MLMECRTNGRISGWYGEDGLFLSLSLSYIASIDTKIISKSNMLLLKKISEKYLLDKERIIIFQFE